MELVLVSAFWLTCAAVGAVVVLAALYLTFVED